ncbi:MAG: DUF1343 domain-containing protein [Bacteroidota bacterium]
MLTNLKIILCFLWIVPMINSGGCRSKTSETGPVVVEETSVADTSKVLPIRVGAAQMDRYLDKLKGKKVALVVNQTSRVGSQHLVDTLLASGIDIRRLFAPEHGFRGEADAGEQIKDGVDTQTGVPVISLYGNNKKPSAAHLKGLDYIVFDIQDVGARFYTYISTMHYVMEACAEEKVAFLVLDRPNPNGHYVDGPLLNLDYQSFVGMHPIPVVHGMTIAEYARMINGEAWLKEGQQCQLEWVLCENYDHQRFYELPIKPSPNLPNSQSIYLYPSLCFFEGTVLSAGRGTNKQFQIYGHPNLETGDFQFTPQSMPGAKYPKHEGKTCRGVDLSQMPTADLQAEAQLNLDYLLNAYQNFPDKAQFFLPNHFIDKLAGSDQLRKQIEAGQSAFQIRQSWAAGLQSFKLIRRKYLLYEDALN